MKPILCLSFIILLLTILCSTDIVYAQSHKERPSRRRLPTVVSVSSIAPAASAPAAVTEVDWRKEIPNVRKAEAGWSEWKNVDEYSQSLFQRAVSPLNFAQLTAVQYRHTTDGGDVPDRYQYKYSVRYFGISRNALIRFRTGDVWIKDDGTPDLARGIVADLQ